MVMQSMLAKLRQAEATLTDAGHVDVAAYVGSFMKPPSEQLQPALQHMVQPSLCAAVCMHALAEGCSAAITSECANCMHANVSARTRKDAM